MVLDRDDRLADRHAVVEEIRPRVQTLEVAGLLADRLAHAHPHGALHLALVKGRWDAADTPAWLDMYQKNLLSAVRLIRLLTPQMRALGWGRVIQLGTIGSTQPNALRPAYYAAKSALASIAVTLSQELAGTGITVNTVSPGLIRTPEVEAAFRAKARREGWDDDWALIEARIVAKRFPNPLNRIATREEVADLVAYLTWMAEPMQNQRVRIGVWVLLFLTGFFVIAWRLNAVFWKDVK